MPVTKFALVGGGITGLGLAEILTRNPNNEVVLYESSDKLGRGLTEEFHEWFHTGALYTILNNPYTFRFVLNCLDDLFFYYSNFKRMNLEKEFGGINTNSNGWFTNDKITLALRKRYTNIPWTFKLIQTISRLNKFNEYDWLRWNMSSDHIFKTNLSSYKKSIEKIITNNVGTYSDEDWNYFETADRIMNSRKILSDFLIACINRNNFELHLNSTATIFDDRIYVNNKLIKYDYAVFASGKSLTSFNLPIKITYSPTFAVKFDKKLTPVVFLDNNKHLGVNIFPRKNKFGTIGGMSESSHDGLQDYLFNRLQWLQDKFQTNIQVLDKWISKRTEFIYEGEDRNYCYHILNSKIYKNIFFVTPGKFSLIFSLAPEFYRRIFMKNPPNINYTTVFNSDDFCHDLIAPTRMQAAINKYKEVNLTL